MHRALVDERADVGLAAVRRELLESPRHGVHDAAAPHDLAVFLEEIDDHAAVRAGRKGRRVGRRAGRRVGLCGVLLCCLVISHAIAKRAQFIFIRRCTFFFLSVPVWTVSDQVLDLFFNLFTFGSSCCFLESRSFSSTHSAALVAMARFSCRSFSEDS